MELSETSETESDEQSDETQQQINSVNLVAKKNTKSKVWKYFGFVPNEDGSGPSDSDSPKCKLCLKNVSARWANTSNLLNHLKLHHISEYKEIARARSSTEISSSSRKSKVKTDGQQTLEQCIEKVKKFSTSSKEHRKLTEVVTNCIVRDVMPVYTVDKTGFRAMIQALNPRYQLPHKDYFSRVAIPSMYENTREQISLKMKKEAHYFSATTDLWSSCTSEPYLSLTVHYIDTEWNLQSHCLQANYMPEDHTGEQLQDALSTSFDEWNLDSRKLVAITTDNGSNIKLACQLLKFKRLSCFGHNLDLAINKGLKDSRIDRVLGLCRKVIASFSYSWKRQRDLKEIQQQKDLPLKKLKGDVCTRWGSTADMVERILEQQDAIRAVLSQDRKVSHLVPSWQDFDILNSVLEAVKGFKDLTDLLSGEKRVTCSAIKPLIEVIHDKIVIPRDDDTTMTTEIKQRIKSDLDGRYQSDEMSSLLDTCAFLDPRFKDKFSLEDETVVTLMNEIEMLDELERASGIEQPTEDDSPEPPRKKGKFSAIFGTSSSSSSKANMHDVSVSDRVKREVDMYLQYPRLDIDESPLKWWQLECNRMPLLSVAARKYLCVCATSVTSERVFSVGGQLVNSRRSRLNPEKVNNLIFLAKNLNYHND